VFREEGGRVLATLTRALGSLDLAQDALAEALTQALQTWPRTGLPRNPAAWVMVTARSRAVDRLRRESSRGDREREASRLAELRALPEHLSESAVRDDVLRLIFTCCHPALSEDARVALTLTVVLGLPTADVARSLLLGVSTLQQRLVRAKRKISSARIPYSVPRQQDLPARLDSVLSVVEVLLAQGHLAPSGRGSDGGPVDLELTGQALRLADLLVDLLPAEPEVRGLRALARIVHARMPARVDDEGELVLLAQQDRVRWDQEAIAVAAREVDALVRQGRVGPYVIQAAIAATHAVAASWEDTDFSSLQVLWDVLLGLRDTPVTRLNRAVVVAESQGPREALREVDDVVSSMPAWHLGHAVRAELLQRLGRPDEAREALQEALGCDCHPAEQRLLGRRLRALAEAAG
jgi:RNA polymerase sigma-70 factor (ECF subfamily)